MRRIYLNFDNLKNFKIPYLDRQRKCIYNGMETDIKILTFNEDTGKVEYDDIIFLKEESLRNILNLMSKESLIDLFCFLFYR